MILVKIPAKITAAVGLFGLLISMGFSTNLSADDIDRYINMSLEELMSLKVTSVAKKSQLYSDTDAAVYVITNEQIRRSGAITIPELLRLVPGLHVARASSNTWAISSRGFNGEFANKLLVLMDGRTLYTPIFAGVYWDVQDTFLEDIERIEVIRGPGGTLWGENAVNGVINIITKKASATQGGRVSTAFDKDTRIGSARYGTALKDNLYARGYLKYKNQDELPSNFSNANGFDNREFQQTGFRLDYDINQQRSLRLQGDIYYGEEEQLTAETSLTPPFSTLLPVEGQQKGANILMKYENQFSENHDWSIQAYYDYTNREEDIGNSQKVKTYDFDFQHQFPLFSHNIIWGLNYRGVSDEITNTFTVSFTPEKRDTNYKGVFIQDSFWINKVRFTLGSKFSWNSYTGFEYQPNLRMLYKLNDNHSLWSAISRAVQIPSRSLSDIRINIATIPGATPTLISIKGNKDIDSVEVTSIELGYKGQFNNKFSADVAAFYNHYHKLVTQEVSFTFEPFPTPSHAVFNRTFTNAFKANAYGVELNGNMQVRDNWLLRGAFSWLNIEVTDKKNINPLDKIEIENTDPEYQFQLHSHWNINNYLDMDTSLYYVDKVRALNISDYTRLDIKFIWHYGRYAVNFGAKNLMEANHNEFIDASRVSSEIPRTYFINASIEF